MSSLLRNLCSVLRYSHTTHGIKLVVVGATLLPEHTYVPSEPSKCTDENEGENEGGNERKNEAGDKGRNEGVNEGGNEGDSEGEGGSGVGDRAGEGKKEQQQQEEEEEEEREDEVPQQQLKQQQQEDEVDSRLAEENRIETEKMMRSESEECVNTIMTAVISRIFPQVTTVIESVEDKVTVQGVTVQVGDGEAVEERDDEDGLINVEDGKKIEMQAESEAELEIELELVKRKVDEKKDDLENDEIQSEVVVESGEALREGKEEEGEKEEEEEESQHSIQMIEYVPR